jgi:lysophospholipase
MCPELRNYQGSLQPRDFPALPANWKSESDTFPGSAPSLHLFEVLHQVQGAPPGGQAPPWKALFTLHGFGEHGGRYLHFPHYVKNTVGSVYCVDHRGHGRSEGLRGHVDRFDIFIEDTAIALERLHAGLIKKFGKAEIHLFGHSFGGLLALHIMHHPVARYFKSATISAPLLGIRVPVPALKKLASRTLNHLWSTLQMSTGFDAAVISHDPAVVEAYRADRLVHGKITPRMFWEMNYGMDLAFKLGVPEQIPVQFLVPEKDEVVSADATKKFFSGLKVRPDSRLITYSDFFHESFNEIAKEKAFQDLNTWLQQHTSAN